jgi:hypothetical protein
MMIDRFAEPQISPAQHPLSVRTSSTEHGNLFLRFQFTQSFVKMTIRKPQYYRLKYFIVMFTTPYICFLFMSSYTLLTFLLRYFNLPVKISFIDGV